MLLYGPQPGHMTVLPSQGLVVVSQPGMRQTILVGPSIAPNLCTHVVGRELPPADDGAGVEAGWPSTADGGAEEEPD